MKRLLVEFDQVKPIGIGDSLELARLITLGGVALRLPEIKPVEPLVELEFQISKSRYLATRQFVSEFFVFLFGSDLTEHDLSIWIEMLGDTFDQLIDLVASLEEMNDRVNEDFGIGQLQFRPLGKNIET
jgi:hypothetical protein